MNTVRRRAQALRDAIEESELYSRYMFFADQVRSDEALQKRTENYRRELFDLQKSEHAPDREAFLNLEKKYEDLLKDVRVIRFLSAESALMDMITEAMEIVGSVTVDLDFLKGSE